MSQPVIGSPVLPKTRSHLPVLYDKDVIPLRTYEPNELARDETPHLAIHIIKYMAMIEIQKRKTNQVVNICCSALVRP